MITRTKSEWQGIVELRNAECATSPGAAGGMDKSLVSASDPALVRVMVISLQSIGQLPESTRTSALTELRAEKLVHATRGEIPFCVAEMSKSYLRCWQSQ
jgi:hypothetical protein